MDKCIDAWDDYVVELRDTDFAPVRVWRGERFRRVRAGYTQWRIGMADDKNDAIARAQRISHTFKRLAENA